MPTEQQTNLLIESEMEFGTINEYKKDALEWEQEYNKLFSRHAQMITKAHKMADALKEAGLQIEYLHEKFSETGSGNNVLSRIEAVLSEWGGGKEGEG